VSSLTLPPPPNSAAEGRFDPPSYGDANGLAPEVAPIEVLSDWDQLSADEFFHRYDDRPVILAGLGHRTAAMSRWTNDFFSQFGDELVKVRLQDSLQLTSAGMWGSHMKLSRFIEAVQTTPGLYLSEWYFFRDHMQHMQDVVGALPDYLLEDWLELIPEGWALGRAMRNNVYWGGHGSSTACHADNFNAQTWNITLRGTKRWLLVRTRDVDPSMRSNTALARLGELGYMTKGFWELEGIRRYLAAPPPKLTVERFCAADVRAGDAIFVPARWAHQVHNIGESLAVSRYFVSANNYAGCRHDIERRFGPLSGSLLDAVLGGPRRRSALRSGVVRKALSSTTGRRAFHFIMRQTPLYRPDAMLT